MGRQAHLERLALGRSAFQDEQALSNISDGETDDNLDSAVDESQDEQGYKQQYDSKGRPINPATEARNQAMRDAQNGVLAVVGVVEAKESLEHELDRQLLSKQQARAKLLKAEQARGELVDLLVSFLGLAVTWWPEALLRRVQIGLYSRSLSFAKIVSLELSTAQSRGLIGAATVFLAGAPASVLCVGLKFLLRWGLEQCVGRLQTWLNGRLSEDTFDQANMALMATAEVGYFAIDAALLPIHFYATTQRLGLTSSQYWVPDWSILSPWSPRSVHSIIWKSAVDIPWLGKLCSPAALLLFQDWLRQDQGLRMLYKGPTSNDIPIDEPYSNMTQHQDDNDDEDWFSPLLHRVNLVHYRIMRWFGWKLEYIDQNAPLWKQYENDHIPSDMDSNASNESIIRASNVYRSTTLSHLPAQYLSDRLYDSFEGLIMLPLDSIVLRAVAQCYLNSSISRPSESLDIGGPLYRPFGGGPLRDFQSYALATRAWSEVGMYMSRLGLSLALHASADILVFFTAYALARWQGVRKFGWGHPQKHDDKED